MSRSDQDRDEFSIELVVRVENVLKTGFRPLLLIHDGDDESQMVVWQWGDSAIVMNGDDYNYHRRRPRLSKRNVFGPVGETYLTITSSEKGTRLYVDGKLTAENRKWQLSIPRKGQKLRLVMGNSVYGIHSWPGEFYGLSIAGRIPSAEEIQLRYNQWNVDRVFNFQGLDSLLIGYAFQEKEGDRIIDHSGYNQHLQIPSRITPLKRAFLTSPWHAFAFNRTMFLDAMINFFGFVPLGFLLHGRLKGKARMIDRNRLLSGS